MIKEENRYQAETFPDSALGAVDAGDDEVAKTQFGYRIQAYCGFIKKQYGWRVNQRSGQIAAHPLTEAQLPNRRVEQRVQIEHADQLVAAVAITRLIYPVDVA